jgi:hypothetical protein
MPGLRLGLTIYESDPKLSGQARTGSDLLTSQLWIGGVTNRKTRTMTEEPRRWLLLLEAASALPVIVPTDGVLLQWDLEQIYPGDHKDRGRPRSRSVLATVQPMGRERLATTNAMVAACGLWGAKGQQAATGLLEGDRRVME